MEQLSIIDPAEHSAPTTLIPGAAVVLLGTIQNLRRLSWGGFALLRTPQSMIQLVLDAGSPQLPLDQLRPETTVRVTGTVKSATITDRAVHPTNVEIHASAIEVISQPSIAVFPVDITKKELNAGLSTLFDHRPLTLRHPKQRALFRIQAAVQNVFGDYLSAIGFTRIASPKLVFSGAEGGADIFKLDYFGRQAFLAQSPQFYKQMMVGVFSRVYEIGPVYRAERHNTSRHLNEYISLDLEMQIDHSFHEIIQVEANTLNAILERIEATCSHEVGLLELKLPSRIDRLTLVDFAEALEIIYREYGFDQRDRPDLTPESEGHICDYAKRSWDTDFVFVTGFPTEKRPFYAMNDPANPRRTLSFDLLFRGLEITTGGQRLHQYDDYIQKMTQFGMDPTPFAS